MTTHDGTSRTDSEVIAASLQQPQEFGAVFDRHFVAIYRFLARRVDSSLAEDLAADVFLTAFRQRERYDQQRADSLPWLYGIAHNLLRNRLRAERRRLELEMTLRGLLELSLPQGGSAERILDLEHALMNLSEQERDIVLLFALEDLSYEEIGRTLGIPIGTVRSKLHRARRRLRGDISEEGIIVEEEGQDG